MRKQGIFQKKYIFFENEKELIFIYVHDRWEVKCLSSFNMPISSIRRENDERERNDRWYKITISLYLTCSSHLLVLSYYTHYNFHRAHICSQKKKKLLDIDKEKEKYMYVIIIDV